MSNFGSTTAATPASSSPTRYDAQPRSSWVIWRKIIAGWRPAMIFSRPELGARVESQVGVAGGDDDVLVLAAVVDNDLAVGDADQRPVAAVDGLPHGAAHSRDAVAAGGLVLAAVIGGPERTDHALGLRARCAGAGIAVGGTAVGGGCGDLAADVTERATAQAGGGRAGGGLTAWDLGAGEGAGLRRPVGKAVDEGDHALVGIDEHSDGDARGAVHRHEPAVALADQHLAGRRGDEHVGRHPRAE